MVATRGKNRDRARAQPTKSRILRGESRAQASLHAGKALGPGPQMPKKVPSIFQNIFISTPPDFHDGSSVQHVRVCQF